MQQRIKFLLDILNQLDNDPNKSTNFLNSPPTVNSKWMLLEEALHRIEHNIRHSDDCTQVDSYVHSILTHLNVLYQRNQHNCWISHTHHFHTCFQDYVNCPVTCLTEIAEYLSKVMKENYTT